MSACALKPEHWRRSAFDVNSKKPYILGQGGPQVFLFIWVQPINFYDARTDDMTTKGFSVSHAKGAQFETGLRSFYDYRDLGIKAATEGRVQAHVIRATAGEKFSGQAHFHETTFQLVYVIKGWIEFEYEGQGIVRLEAGSCVHQSPHIRHRELGHSDDVEMLEVVMPAGFATKVVDSVNG